MKDEKKAVLIAEDEEINRTILREILKDKYRVLEAENGAQAVYCIQGMADAISLIILDIHMPKLDGFGVMDYLVESGLKEKIPVIVTTADQSTDVLITAKQNKVADIIYKPFSAANIRRSVDTLITICGYEQNLDSIIEEKSMYISNQLDAIKKVRTYFMRPRWEEIVKKLSAKLLPDEIEHNERVRRYVSVLADGVFDNYRKYGLSKMQSDMITSSCVLHDIGKCVIPDEVFNKYDASAPRALIQLKKRPVAAAEMINLLFANSGHQAERKCSYDICKFMYEQFDGKGYPDGLVGNEIPISAQIVGLAHRYDELRFPKDGVPVPHPKVLRILCESEYKAFNPDLLELLEEREETLKEISETKYEKEKE